MAKKKFLPDGGSWQFFISSGRWIGNEQLFKIGLIKYHQEFCSLHYFFSTLILYIFAIFSLAALQISKNWPWQNTETAAQMRSG